MFESKIAWVTSIATFVLSVFVQSALDSPVNLPNVEVDYAYLQRDENVVLTGQIEIEKAFFKLGDNRKEVTFKVTNKTERTIHYPGYERDHNALVWVRQNGKIKDALDLPCWQGVETQSLEPTQEAYFSAPVPHNGKPFQVGFDFRVDTRSGWKTVWVNSEELGN